MQSKERSVCTNLWCKAIFEYIPVEGEPPPKVCNKCISFDSDLSGGVTWTDKTYEGSRFDNQPHEININIKKFIK